VVSSLTEVHATPLDPTIMNDGHGHARGDTAPGRLSAAPARVQPEATGARGGGPRPGTQRSLTLLRCDLVKRRTRLLVALFPGGSVPLASYAALTMACCQSRPPVVLFTQRRRDWLDQSPVNPVTRRAKR
jgi:hypothetical protein